MASRDDLEARLSGWWQHARDLWRDARHEMAVDDDYVDTIQYDAETLEALKERGQPAIAYNEIAAGVFWLTGTERRSRMDWRVLPRESDDVQLAKVKTDCLKYLEDVNRAAYQRSRAFESAVRVGVGWLECGRQEPLHGGEPLFYRHEDWRNVWLDPASRAPDINDDARFICRSKVVDLDVAVSLFPSREDALTHDAYELGREIGAVDDDVLTHPPGDDGSVPWTTDGYGGRHEARRVVRLVEVWYRVLADVHIISGRGAGALDGAVFNPRDRAMSVFVAQGLAAGLFALVRSRRMLMRVAMLTHHTGSLLADSPSPYRHQRFPFVPVWGRRRGRDGAPYGPPRAARGPQDAVNKRNSKAVHLLSVQRTIAEEDAILDLAAYEEEINRPDGIITCLKRGAVAEGRIKIDFAPELAAAHVNMAARDAEFVRNTMGVTGEQLGRETNAQSGRAVIARQEQGSVTTADLFDNLRFAAQLSGEMMLSLIEQYWTEPKTVRITGERTEQFARINQPQPDGTWSDDITASKADFVVSDQDWRATVRIAASEQFGEMLTRVNPQIAESLMDLWAEGMDLPNKDEIVKRIRQITGQPDPLDQSAVAAAQQAQAAQQQRAEEQRQAEIDRLRSETARNYAASDQAAAAARKALVDALPGALAAALQAIQNPQLAVAADALMASAAPHEPPK